MRAILVLFLFCSLLSGPIAAQELPVELTLPDNFTTDVFGSEEGTAVLVSGGEGDLHIFLPNPKVIGTGEASVIGPGGLFESNGWESQEVGRKNQPQAPWATHTFPFFGEGGLEGVVWLGKFGQREVRVTASAPEELLGTYYGQIAELVRTLKLK